MEGLGLIAERLWVQVYVSHLVSHPLVSTIAWYVYESTNTAIQYISCIGSFDEFNEEDLSNKSFQSNVSYSEGT